MSEKIEVEENNSPTQMVEEEDVSQDQFKTPHKQSGCKQNLQQTSPSFLNQVQVWKDSLEKYKNDPDIANVINQMNETIQFHPQTSEQQQSQESPRKILEEQSFGNQSYRFDNLQKLIENVNQIQEEIHNQSFQSPRTIDLSRCNETFSEIKQCVQDIEKSYKCIKYNIVDKDEELHFLSHQLEKEFNLEKQTRQIKSMETVPNGFQSEVFQIYNKAKQARKNRANSLKVKQMGKIRELRECLTELKDCQRELPKRIISIFKDDVMSEASKFYSVINENNQFQEQLTQLHQQLCDDLKNPTNQQKMNDYANKEIFSVYYQLREFYQLQIEKLNTILKDSENEFKQQLHSLNQSFPIDENLWQNILNICNLQGIWGDQQFFAQILQSLYNKITESQNDVQMLEEKHITILSNLNLRNSQLQNQFDQKVFEFNNQLQTKIIDIKQVETQNQSLEQQIKLLKHEKNQMIQEVEELKLRDNIAQSIQLIQLEQQSMKQQQQLIYIGLKIFQQFLIVTSNDKNLVMCFQNQTEQLSEFSKKLGQAPLNDQIQISEAFELIRQNSLKVDDIIDEISNQYRSIIQNMKLSQEEWIKQFQ